MVNSRTLVATIRRFSLAGLPVLLLALSVTPLGRAQTQPTPQSQPDQATPDSGGPGADSGVIALPKKKDKTEEAPTPVPAEPKIKNPEGMANFSLRIEVPEVTVDVGVLLEKSGQFIPRSIRPCFG